MSLEAMLRIIDASSIIYGWDNYPPDQFPPLWEWIESEISDGLLKIPSVALDEVHHKLKECSDWLNKNGIEKLEASNDILRVSISIQTELGIAGDDYHSDGVGENDIIIISTAKTFHAELISNENVQPTLPANKKKYKIPATCRLPTAGVSCINFLQYLRQSGQVFR